MCVLTKMGAFVTKTWYVYARDTNDKWLEAPLYSTVAKEDNEKHHVGMFKYRIFQFALEDNLFAHCSKIYLYHGWRRIKVHKEKQTLIVTFTDQSAQTAWDTCKRSRLANSFDAIWSLKSNKSLVYTFKKKTLCEIIK